MDKAFKNYFPAVKFVCIVVIVSYIIVNRQSDALHISSMVCLFAIFLLLGLMVEYWDRGRWLCWAGEGLLLWAAYYFLSADSVFLLPVFLLDAVVLFHGKWYFYQMPLIFLGMSEDIFLYFLCSLFWGMIYLQHHMILKQYRSRIDGYEQEEYELKDAIDRNELKVREQIKQNGLINEIKLLEERARISQELHDKLGHGINGSIYQLEACKILLDKDTVRSRGILQSVIDCLRMSMDEIREILRREKPDKKQTALIQLHGLKDECLERYNIHMEIVLEGNIDKIGDSLWEAILDNVYECVTNALKYSGCSKMEVGILGMNKVVRCYIRDDGMGCAEPEVGMGLKGMRQRVRRLGGTMDIHSGDGFLVNMLFPDRGDS